MYLITLFDRKTLKVGKDLGEKVSIAKASGKSLTFGFNGGVYDIRSVSRVEPLTREKFAALPAAASKPVSKETLLRVRAEVSNKFNLTPPKNGKGKKQ